MIMAAIDKTLSININDFQVANLLLQCFISNNDNYNIQLKILLILIKNKNLLSCIDCYKLCDHLINVLRSIENDDNIIDINDKLVNPIFEILLFSVAKISQTHGANDLLLIKIYSKCLNMIVEYITNDKDTENVFTLLKQHPNTILFNLTENIDIILSFANILLNHSNFILQIISHVSINVHYLILLSVDHILSNNNDKNVTINNGNLLQCIEMLLNMWKTDKNNIFSNYQSLATDVFGNSWKTSTQIFH